ncbi:hypothetical protein [Aureimonas sp. AU22]|uniref:hypothetical protein n=1 Tax=Aureimonas sp. AU22 TaxID=1638162 RepID=UPI00078374D8|nr:hypothetical protein [Aureimonas sp. AU22]
MESTYRAAIVALPGWTDEAIVECDLVRLNTAIRSANDRIAADWRQRARLRGHDVPEPEDEAEPQTDEEFNAQFRQTLARFKRAAAAPSGEHHG